MANAVSLSNYTFTGSEKFLVDANVWLYLYGPLNNQYDHGYSKIIPKVFDNTIKLFINDLIISEFVNRTCRLAYNKYLQKNQLNSQSCDFKKVYRNTQDFKDIYKLTIETIEQDVLTISTYVPVVKDDLFNGISNLSADDFNDELIVQTALSQGLSIITHDRDFHSHPADVSIFHY